jgi:predicted ATP-grasp superfamily ATP-dependent carboligase
MSESDTLYELIERPDLESPVLVLGLEGWIDAGLGAAAARALLLETLDTVTIARFDADLLLDHRARRPVMHLTEGVVKGLTWPSTELRAASDARGNDLLLLVGAEPDHSWPSFTRAVVSLALDLGCRLVVGLGAYPAPVPHTRPSRLALSTSSPQLADPSRYVLASIDAPAGVQAAIEHHAAECGMAATGLWAQVPHYAAAMPYPGASAALVDGVATLGDVVLDSTELHRQAEATRQRLDALVADNAEHLAMVHTLEAQWDAAATGTAAEGLGAGRLPSGDELAAEVERYLRDRDR